MLRLFVSAYDSAIGCRFGSGQCAHRGRGAPGKLIHLDGTIASIFPHSMNLDFGGNLISLVLNRQNLGPRAALVVPAIPSCRAAEADRLPPWVGLKPGDRARALAGRILLGNDPELEVDWGAGRPLDLGPPRSRISPHRRRRGWRLSPGWLKHLQELNPADSEPIAIQLSGDDPVLEGGYYRRMRTLKSPVSCPADSTRAGEWVNALLGAGPGFTPAGDDFLAGLLATGRWLEIPAEAGIVHWAPVWAGAVLTALERHPRSTTWISAVMLRNAAEGRIALPLRELLQTIFIGPPSALERRLTRARALGHSSGTAMVAGMMMAFCMSGHRPDN